jgi:hypothetical protein
LVCERYVVLGLDKKKPAKQGETGSYEKRTDEKPEIRGTE